MSVKDVPKPRPMPDFMAGWLASEKSQQDKITVKRVYIDLNEGNLHDGLIFSQIMYWHTPTDEGKTRLTAFKEGYWWLAKAYTDWWEECRINEHTARKSIDRLKERGLIETKIFRFNGTPKIHLRVNWEIVDKHLRSTCYPVSSGLDTTGQIGLDTTYQVDPIPQVKSLTDTTAKTTQKLQAKKKEIASSDADTRIHQQAEEIAERAFSEPAKPKRERKLRAPKPVMVKAPIVIDPEYRKQVQTTFIAYANQITGIASQLLNLAEKGAYADNAIVPPVELSELRQFHTWQRRVKGKEYMPKEAIKVQSLVYEWRDTSDYKRWLEKQQQPKPEAKALEVKRVELVEEPVNEETAIIQRIWDEALARGENPALAALAYAQKKLSGNSADLKEKALEARRAATTES